MAAPIPLRPPFQLGSFPIDEPRPIKVAVIGAGYSGKLKRTPWKTLLSAHSVFPSC